MADDTDASMTPPLQAQISPTEGSPQPPHSPSDTSQPQSATPSLSQTERRQPHAQYAFQDMVDAITRCVAPFYEPQIRMAQLYNVPASTLNDKLAKVTPTLDPEATTSQRNEVEQALAQLRNGRGALTKLSEEQEKKLAQHIAERQAAKEPMKKADVQAYAAKMIGSSKPLSNKWYSGFIERCPTLTSRRQSSTALRARAQLLVNTKTDVWTTGQNTSNDSAVDIDSLTFEETKERLRSALQQIDFLKNQVELLKACAFKKDRASMDDEATSKVKTSKSAAKAARAVFKARQADERAAKKRSSTSATDDDEPSKKNNSKSAKALDSSQQPFIPGSIISPLNFLPPLTLPTHVEQVFQSAVSSNTVGASGLSTMSPHHA